VIVDVASSLEAMRPEQYVLGFVFLGSYAFALGQLFEQRGRQVCAGLSFVSALAFIARCDPWEQGFMLVALALVGIGILGATAWLFWTAATWREMRAARSVTVVEAAPEPQAVLAPRLPSGALLPVTRSS
jgi:hypothetical protein